MAYSGDLRVRLIRSVGRGKAARSQAKFFEVSASTAVKWMQAFRAEGARGRKPHRGGRRSILDAHGAWLRARIALPAPYSPRLNPTGQAFSKLKAHLRKHAERNAESPWDRIGALMAGFNPTQCRNFLNNAGFRSANRKYSLSHCFCKKKAP